VGRTSLLRLWILVLLLTRGAAAQQPPPDFHVMAMGDWGEDTAAQRDVAGAMSRWAKGTPPNAVLLLGDNFYFTLTGPDDPRWQRVFERVYDPATLNVPFYSCLGNHEYGLRNLDTELAYSRQHPESRFKLPARWYRIDLPKEKPVLTVLILDSDKDFLSDAQWNEQIKWLKDELDKPRGTWTICCAHHPLYSNGFFWANGVLQKDWGLLFEKSNVDFYLCGHEHNLQHLEIPGSSVSYVIAGGGGAHAAPLMRDNRGFSREAFGFADFELTPDSATVRIIGTDDKPMHVFERTKSGRVRIIETTPNSKPVNPLDAYLQLDRRRRAATQPAKAP
jgi:hypothetical protein